MKIEISKKDEVTLIAQILYDKVNLELDVPDEDPYNISLDVEEVDFLISNLKRMSNKIKKGQYECD